MCGPCSFTPFIYNSAFKMLAFFGNAHDLGLSVSSGSDSGQVLPGTPWRGGRVLSAPRTGRRPRLLADPLVALNSSPVSGRRDLHFQTPTLCPLGGKGWHLSQCTECFEGAETLMTVWYRQQCVDTYFVTQNKFCLFKTSHMNGVYNETKSSFYSKNIQPVTIISLTS